MEKIIQEHCYSEDDDSDNTCSLLQLELRVLSVNLPELQEVDTLASKCVAFAPRKRSDLLFAGHQKV